MTDKVEIRIRPVNCKVHIFLVPTVVGCDFVMSDSAKYVGNNIPIAIVDSVA